MSLGTEHTTGEAADPATWSEDELCALALSAEPGRPPADDAVPLSEFLEASQPDLGGRGLLPTWYMPSPMARIRPRWRTPVVLALVAAFLAIEAFGLCSTFGQVVPA